MSFEQTDKEFPYEKYEDAWARAVVTVVSVDGPMATVKAAGTATCGKCSGASGCGTRLLANLLGTRVALLSVDNNLDACVGERIEIGIRQTTMLKLAALSYLVPLAGLLAGGAIADLAGLSDTFSFISGVGGLAMGLAAGRYFFSANRWERRIVPICLRRVVSDREQHVDVRAIS